MKGQGSSGAFAFSTVDGNEKERAKQEGHNPACQRIQTSERTPPGGCVKGPVLTTLCKNCEQHFQPHGLFHLYPSPQILGQSSSMQAVKRRDSFLSYSLMCSKPLEL